jgi:hypothetical protein
VKVSHSEGVAIHAGPESCAVDRKVGGEALIGGRVGWVLSSESAVVWGADALGLGGRQHPGSRYGERDWDPAESKTPSMHASTSHGNREIPWSPAKDDGLAGRIGKSQDVRR